MSAAHQKPHKSAAFWAFSPVFTVSQIKKVTKSVKNYLNLRARAQEPRERTHRCIWLCSASERRVSVWCPGGTDREQPRCAFRTPGHICEGPSGDPLFNRHARTPRWQQHGWARRLYTGPPAQPVRASSRADYRGPTREVDWGGGRSTSSLTYFFIQLRKRNISTSNDRPGLSSPLQWASVRHDQPVPPDAAPAVWSIPCAQCLYRIQFRPATRSIAANFTSLSAFVCSAKFTHVVTFA